MVGSQGILQHRSVVRNLRSGCAFYELVTQTAREQAVLFRNRRGWVESEEVQNQWKRGCGFDGVVFGSICRFTGFDVEVERVNG